MPLPDRAALRRTFASQDLTNPSPPEHIRINLDLGDPLVLIGFIWALVADGSMPTLTVHGSNDPAFFTDMTVVVSRILSADGGRTLNNHTLAFDAHLLWQLHFPFWGSLWTPDDVDPMSSNYSADVYLTRTGPGPHYAQMFPDDTLAVDPFVAFDDEGYVFPDAYPPAYRYYALTISVGAVSPTPTPHVLELQEWQPLLQQPDSILPPQDAAVVYGRTPLPTTDGFYRIRLTKSVQPGASFGYMELWDEFRVPAVFQSGGGWSSRAFSVTNHNSNPRRATVTLVDVAVPRTSKIRGLNKNILTVPFLMCFIRHPCIVNSEDQAYMGLQTIATGFLGIEEKRRPPVWVLQRDTVMFTLMITNARVPGDHSFVGLPSSGSAQVLVTGSVLSAFPECCMVLPTGEVLDFVEYDDDTLLLPVEVGYDDSTSINVILNVQFEEPAFKRVR